MGFLIEFKNPCLQELPLFLFNSFLWWRLDFRRRTPKNSFLFFSVQAKSKNSNWILSLEQKMIEVVAFYIASYDPQKIIQESKMDSSTKDALRISIFSHLRNITIKSIYYETSSIFSDLLETSYMHYWHNRL